MGKTASVVWPPSSFTSLPAARVSAGCCLQQFHIFVGVDETGINSPVNTGIDTVNFSAILSAQRQIPRPLRFGVKADEK
jgi:hypothetical protein